MKIIKQVICIALTATILLNQMDTVSAGIGDYYTSDYETNSVNGGGKIKAYCERQTYGTTSKSGVVRKVKFYVYSKYTGNKTVKSIKCAWVTGAKLRNSATLTLNTSGGSTYSFGASSSSTYQNVESSEKYWSSTNGTMVECENSNFTISPDCDLYGYLFWIKCTATVKVKGGAKSTSISCGC
jgi:hypothetical protein